MHSRFFTVVTRSTPEQVERYLYDHSRLVSATFKMPSYSVSNAYVIETTGSNDVQAAYSAECQAGRLASGLGAVSPVAETYQAAIDRLVEVFGAEVTS